MLRRHRHHRPPKVSRRAGAVGDAAAHLGLQFTAEDHLHLDRLPFSFLRGNDGRQVANTAWGTVDGMSVWLFDAWLRSRRLPGGGPHLTCAATVVTAGFPGVAVVGVDAVPGGRDLEGIGYRSVEVTGPLAERFDVWTADPAFCADLLQPAMSAWLAEGDTHDRYETAGPYLVMAVPACEPDELPGLLDHLKDFRAHLPSGLAGRWPPGASAGPTRRARR